MPESPSETWITVRLAKKYSPPDWAFFPQLRAGTGFRRDRTADAVAMSLWESRGLELHGFEIKVSRSDWLHELKQPAKADMIHGFCDRWWVVADPSVVKVEELPKGWGLQVTAGDEIRVKVQAGLNPNVKPVDRLFIASMMRNLHKRSQSWEQQELIRAEVDKTVKDRVKVREEDLDREKKKCTEELIGYKQRVNAFERASGIPLNMNWGDANVERIGQLVRFVQNWKPDQAMLDQIRSLEQSIATLDGAKYSLESRVKAIKALIEQDTNKNGTNPAS